MYQANTLKGLQTAQHYRTEELPVILSEDINCEEGKDLEYFQEKLKERFTKFGVDTVSYIPDPIDLRQVWWS